MRDIEELRILYRVAMGLGEGAQVSDRDIKNAIKKDKVFGEVKKEIEKDRLELVRVRSRTERMLNL